MMVHDWTWRRLYSLSGGCSVNVPTAVASLGVSKFCSQHSAWPHGFSVWGIITQPHHSHHCHCRRDPGGALVPQTSHSHLSGWRERALSRGFSGWFSTHQADSTISRNRDMLSPGRGSARTGTSPLCCPKCGTRWACPRLNMECENQALSHSPEEHHWGLGVRSGIF